MTTTTTTTTANTAPAALPATAQLTSEAYNYANAANRIAAWATAQLKAARKTYELTGGDDLTLSYYAKGTVAAARKSCEHASRAKANTPGSYLHHHNTKQAAEWAGRCERDADRLANLLAELELANDDGTGW